MISPNTKINYLGILSSSYTRSASNFLSTSVVKAHFQNLVRREYLKRSSVSRAFILLTSTTHGFKVSIFKTANRNSSSSIKYLKIHNIQGQNKFGLYRENPENTKFGIQLTKRKMFPLCALCISICISMSLTLHFVYFSIQNRTNA